MHDTSILSRRRPSTTLDLAFKQKLSADVRRPAIQSPEIEDLSGLNKNLQLDMKLMVGGAVGNMSISPYSRDIVLAARRGLFIIDLEGSLGVPRFLPQGGTWDVADVQWNPHTSRAEYIVSTSSEKLLIWNLMASGNSNIEHILSAHYRAITDINWHTTEPDIVSSTGIDSWVWTWDLREPRKATFGLCAFKAPGTQVKWNRQDPNILASAHGNQVLIWDRRKGSLPMSEISAHGSKIYGIDWSHYDSKEIVTCSLDKTIKVWDMNEVQEAKAVIHTAYPVWRARNLPFGRGVLSLAQRGETMLELYATDDPRTPIHEFEGHTDVVKEFVWRRGGQDGNTFQLITWSKDRTLRFWIVDQDIIERVGSTPARPRNFDPKNAPSYRTPLHTNKSSVALSAPVGHRSILAEVRAGAHPCHDHAPPTAHKVSTSKMTRGSGKTTSRQVDGLTWLASVRVEDSRRGSSSNPGSEGNNSAEASRMSSRSRGTEDDRRRSESRSRGALSVSLEEPQRESLQDEITRVMTALSSNKVKLEHHELTAKKRFCTIGLHGPWGQSSTVSVFMRITFNFPKDYPHGHGPDSTPSVNLDATPLVSNNDRARILRKLKTIREERRPCLEACLRFLLFKNENVNEKPIHLDSESSDEDGVEEDDGKRREREHTLALLRNNKNLAEPRTTQGTFGPNGELVCFFNNPPRSMKGIPRLVESPSATPEEADDMYQSPALATDAIRHLEAAAVDHQPTTIPRRGDDLIKFITNVLTFSQPRFRDRFRTSQQRYVAPQKTTVLLLNTTAIAGGDKKAARGYIFNGASFVEEDAGQDGGIGQLCTRNADVARVHGRYDHARVFMTLSALLSFQGVQHDGLGRQSPSLWKLIKQMMDVLAQQKDVQMLAMVAMTVLQVIPPFQGIKSRPATLRSPRHASFRPDDYFSLSTAGPKSPMWARHPSSPTNLPSASSSSSRAGSWSSLFTMRQFMADKLDSFKDGGAPAVVEEASVRSLAIPIPTVPVSPQPQPLRKVESRSWTVNEEKRRANAVSFSPAKPVVPRKRIVFEKTVFEEAKTHPFDRDDVQLYVRYVQSYAEILFRWELHHKRLELLKVVDPHVTPSAGPHEIGVSRICAACHLVLPSDVLPCPTCSHPPTMPSCSICRLPVRGLSQSCTLCLHVVHISCGRKVRVMICPSGCGCMCTRK